MNRINMTVNAKTSQQGTNIEDRQATVKRQYVNDNMITEPSSPSSTNDKEKMENIMPSSLKTGDEDKMRVTEQSTLSTGTDDKRKGKIDARSLRDNKSSFSESNKSQTAETKVEKRIFNEDILNELSQFLNGINKNDIPDEVMVDCGFWDFAGQRQYYPTHQIFLNPNALHLLVTDIMKDIKQITVTGYDKIGEYIDFWFDSIHSCRAVEDATNYKGEFLNPPVIVVCTGIDKCKDEVDEKKKMFRTQLMSLLGNEAKRKHLRRICYISNTKPVEEDLDDLRNSIFEFGKNIGTFGERLPLKWIRLEQAVDIVCGGGVNILSRTDMADLASKCLIEDENELSLFLKYHHKIGNIIYFESLKEHIILNHKWLADAFKCLIADEDKYDRDLKLTLEWKTLEETGKLKSSLIKKLFQKEPELEFYKHESHILKVLEMFGIIFKPNTLKKDAVKQSYYMPCMISEHKETPITHLYNVFDVKNAQCTRTPWLCIEFKFMPFDFFNHICCHYVKKYYVCTDLISRRVALYHGIGVFFQDKTKFSKFILCFSKNTIGMQIWQWQNLEQGKYKLMLEELKSVIHTVKDTYEPRRVSYSVKTKCADGNIHIVAGRHSYTELINFGDKYFCEEHNEIHDTRDFFQTWFEEDSEMYMSQAMPTAEKAEEPYLDKVVDWPDLVNGSKLVQSKHIKRTTDKDLEKIVRSRNVYNMTGIKKGKVIIISNVKRSPDSANNANSGCPGTETESKKTNVEAENNQGKDRFEHCSKSVDFDKTNIQQLFKYMKFDTTIPNKNMTRQEILQLLQETAYKDESYNSLVVVILSAGQSYDPMQIYDKNGEKVEREEIFKIIRESPAFKGKPKLVIYRTYNFEDKDNDQESPDTLDATKCNIRWPTVSNDDDLFVVTAVPKIKHGPWIVGDNMHGSYFIQALIHVFKDQAQNKPFFDLLEEVNNCLQKAIVPNDKDSQKVTRTAVGEVVVLEYSENKDLYFFP